MASTNKTTYFDLSQYTASDKPTYLVDYNGDMSKIDAGLHEADSDAKTAISEIGDLANLTTSAKNTVVASINEVDAEADANTIAIGNLSNLSTTANTDLVSAINEVDTEADANTTAIGTLANLETTVKTNLVGATNEVNTKIGDLASKFDLIRFNSYGSSEIQFANFQYVNGDITVASNSDYSLLKIYGAVRGTSEANKPTATMTIAGAIPSGYRPDSDIVINPIGIITHDYNSLCNYTCTIKSNGDVVLTLTVGNQAGGFMASAIPFLIFTKNFGDTPDNI